MPAIRDFTSLAFARACKRQGFRIFAGVWIHDRETSNGYGMVFTRDGKPRRRESLARAIKLRNIDRKKGN